MSFSHNDQEDFSILSYNIWQLKIIHRHPRSTNGKEYNIYKDSVRSKSRCPVSVANEMSGCVLGFNSIFSPLEI
jgi:hypothetical protein